MKIKNVLWSLPMHAKEAWNYRRLKQDLDNKKWVDLAYKINFRNSPELRNLADTEFPRSVLIIPDGQRRFAHDARIENPTAYQMGADNLLLQLTTLSQADIPTQTAIAWGFSTDNWLRPPKEIDGLMTLMNSSIPEIEKHLDLTGGRFIHLGRKQIRANMASVYKDYPKLIENMHALENKTSKNPGKVIALAVDFGGFDQDLRTHEEALNTGTIFRPHTKVHVSPEDIWSWRDSAGLIRTVDLAIRTGEQIAAGKGIGTFHSSDTGWLNGKNTQWVNYEKRFPQLTLKDTAQAILTYANARKMHGS